MNSKNENKLKMYLALRFFLRTNDVIASKLPNYAQFLLALDNAIAEIQGGSVHLQMNTKGIAGGKQELRAALETMTADASGKIQAWAKFTNNTVLLAETKFKISTLEHVSDLELVNDAKLLYAKINEHLLALTPYGLTAESQTAYQALISAYETAIPQNRETQVNKKSTNQQLNQAFEAADDAIENIDMLLEIVRQSEAVFYNEYKATRKVIDTASGSWTVQGTVKDKQSKMPIDGATLTFRLSGEDEVALVKQSADKGGFIIKSLDEGIYTVTTTKIGYKTEIMQLTVSNTELNELAVWMVRI